MIGEAAAMPMIWPMGPEGGTTAAAVAKPAASRDGGGTALGAAGGATALTFLAFLALTFFLDLDFNLDPALDLAFGLVFERFDFATVLFFATAPSPDWSFSARYFRS